jgi:hypothetical protein
LEVYELRLQPELPFDSYLDFAKLARTSAGKAPFLNAKKKEGASGEFIPLTLHLCRKRRLSISPRTRLLGSLDQKRKSPD